MEFQNTKRVPLLKLRKMMNISNIILGCPENAKSLKSQAPQGFSDCLDIDNDEMNKKNF